MRLNRFFGDFDLSKPKMDLADPEILHQMRHVLRLKPGETVVLVGPEAKEAEAKILKYQGNHAELEIHSVTRNTREPKNRITLYCAVLKRQNFEWVAEKATELGVSEIVPVRSQRTVKLDLKKERLERITREAAEQSGRGMVPVLGPVISFAEALQHAAKNGKNILFDASGRELSAKTPVSENAPAALGIFIGPEGGWDASELAEAAKAGMAIMSFGPLTLRAETAAIIGSYIAVHSVQE